VSESLSLREKLEIAWRRVIKNRTADFIPMDVEYQVFEACRGELLDEIESQWPKEPKDVVVFPLRRIRVPKSRYTTRPGVLPELADRIVYQASVDDIADAVEPGLAAPDDVLFSCRYRGKRRTSDFLKSPRASYAAFRERSLALGDLHPYVVVADVASCFERISHHDLENTLKGLGAPEKPLATALAMLRKWRMGRSYGVPQGCWPSDYLGNACLSPLDASAKRLGYDYCRYVDDMRIGVAGAVEGLKAVHQLESELDSLGLGPNSEKTMVVRSDELVKVVSPVVHRLQAVVGDQLVEIIIDEIDGSLLTDFEVEGPPAPDAVDVDHVTAVFRSELEQAEPNKTVINYCLGKLRRWRDDVARDDVLAELTRLRQSTPIAMSYLLSLVEQDPDISLLLSEKLAAYLSSEEAVSSWQNGRLLHTLYRLPEVHDGASPLGMRFARVVSGEPDLVRAQGVLVAGRHGSDADRKYLADCYESETSATVGRAILASLLDMPTSRRNHLAKYCTPTNRLSQCFAMCLKQGKDVREPVVGGSA
jgi:Reverse transcriptase (RNA-dependent DNA polymerase)